MVLEPEDIPADYLVLKSETCSLKAMANVRGLRQRIDTEKIRASLSSKRTDDRESVSLLSKLAPVDDVLTKPVKDVVVCGYGTFATTLIVKAHMNWSDDPERAAKHCAKQLWTSPRSLIMPR